MTSCYAPVTVFSRDGSFKHVIAGSPPYVFDIAITPSNQYIIPGKSGTNEFHIYTNQGAHQYEKNPTKDVLKKSIRPRSVAVDSRGRIIVGLGWDDHHTISIYKPDGTLISKFQTWSSPRMLTCTPNDELIISFAYNSLQVMDQSGHNASIIQPPPGIQVWKPSYVCCSKQGELFVSNTYGDPSAVFRYMATPGSCSEYKYLDRITNMECKPWGIALSADEETLYVVDYQSSTIRLFH